jgi:Cu(I)/Ag(I) efflux system membrane fusion protein
MVHKGDALALIYSPEIIAVQGEVLAAGQWADKSARAAVRQRLSLYGLNDAEMDALFREGKPRRLLTLRAPQDGVVLARAAVPGGYAMPDVALYELQDLTTLWLEVAVPQTLLPRLQAGCTALARLEGQAQPVTAQFDRVLPQIDAERRTARVRFVIMTPPQSLLPGAWLQVALPVEVTHDAVLVPRDAVLDTGHEQYVFVAADGGWFLPTKVQVGDLYGENLEIREGLSAGDKVVATAAFLIDAESRVQASVRALSGSAAPSSGGQP